MKQPFHVAAVLVVLTSVGAASADEQPNVLMIILDDLNDWVGFLDGHPDVQTPHMDRLTERGVVFTNAYCVSPICGPSRAAVLTGQRPETTGAYTNVGNYRTYVPNAATFPEVFRRHGFKTLAAGKVNHDLGTPDPRLWDENGPDCGVLGTPFIGKELHVQPVGESRIVNRDGLQITLPANGGLSAIDRPTMDWNSFDWAPLDVPDDDFPDGKIAAWGVEQLANEHDRPFLLVTGFYKPHQPFFAPRRYFDLYNTDEIDLPPTIAGDLYDVPDPGVALARQPWSSGTHRTVVRHNAWRDAVHAYLATVSFADAQVGRLVDALDRSPHAHNTWIVVWSDHGWSLGSKEHWGKHAPWRENVRVPLVIVPPRNVDAERYSRGTRCDAPVSLLDLYPTLLGMCSLPAVEQLEGESLLPLLSNPQPKDSAEKTVATTVGRGTVSIVTRSWRYILYFDGSEELYDRTADPHEWFNLASDPTLAGVKQELAAHDPIDERFRRFVRWDSYKCVIPSEGPLMLFDADATFGIAEQDDLAAEQPQIVAAIQQYLEREQITDRRVNIPTSALTVSSTSEDRPK